MADEASAGPDLGWIERFGAVYEWNATRQQEVVRELRRAVRSKRIAVARQRPSRFYATFYVLTLLGVFISVEIFPTPFQQACDESGWNLTAGAILGATAVGCAFWTHTFAAMRRPQVPDPYWAYTMIRVGVDRDTLWIYKHGTISIFATRDAFVSVKRFGGFIGAYVSPLQAHFLPVDVLEGTENGQKVLDWFEAHWPSDTRSGIVGRGVPRRGFLRSLSRGLVRALCAVGLVLIALEACLFLGSRLQDAFDRVRLWSSKADAPHAARDGRASPVGNLPDQSSSSSSLSGSGATRYIDRLTHPGAQ